MRPALALLFALLLGAPLFADDLTKIPPHSDPQAALRAIEAPLRLKSDYNFSSGEGENSSRKLWASVYYECGEALDVLLDADEEIEKTLVQDVNQRMGLDPRRIRSAYVLALRDDPDIVPLLVSMLHDQDDVRVRYMAEETLRCASVGPRCRAAMEALLSGNKLSERERVTVVEALNQTSGASTDERSTAQSLDDEARALLLLAENLSEPEARREAALRDLGKYDCTDIADRIITVGRSDALRSERYFKPGIAGSCLTALASSRQAAVTRALAEWARDDAQKRLAGGAFAWELRLALNERTGKRYHTLEHAAWHALLATEGASGK